MLWMRTKGPILGVDMTADAVKVVELAQSDESYRVEAYAGEPVPADSIDGPSILDVEAVGKAVRRAVKRAGTRSREAAAAIAGDAVVTRTIRVPGKLSDDEIQGHVAFQVEQFLPFPMEEASLDFEVAGPSEVAAGMSDVLLVATRSVHVTQRQRALRAAGLEARVVEPEPYAVERACRLLTHQMIGGGLRQLIALVDFGAVTTTFSALADGKLIYTRDFAFGGRQLTEEIMDTYGLGVEEAEQAKHAGELPFGYRAEVLDGFLEDMSQQVSRSLQFFLASNSSVGQPVQILVCGGCAKLPGVADAIEARLGIRTQIGDPLGHMNVSARAEAQGVFGGDTGLITACGLALRSCD